MAKLNSSEAKIINEIAKWKSDNPSFLNRATDFVSKPISWLSEKLIPEDVRGSISGVTEKVVEKLQDMSQWSVNHDAVLEATREFDIDATSIAALRKVSIHDLDHIAQKFSEQNTRVATVSGAGTGMTALVGFGWAGLIADLPTLFAVSLRSIYQTALCYGFDLEGDGMSPETRAYEMEYMMRVFKIATASDKVQKQRSLGELKDFEAGRQSELYNPVMGDYAAKQLSKNATGYVSRILIKEIVERTITKKAAALIPGLGVVFSAGFNYVYLQDVGEAAFMIYRERFLLDKQGRKRTIVVDIE